MKIGTLNHIKTKRLKRRLRLPMYQVAGILETLWHLAIESADEGDIGKFSNEDIAMGLEWEGDADELVGALIDSGFVDEDQERRLVIHDWFDHAPDYIKERLRKRGMRQRKRESQCVREVVGQDGTTSGHVPASSDSVPPSSEVVPSIPCHANSCPTQPNPASTSNPPPQPVRSSTGEPATWAEVAEAMKSLRISRKQHAIDAAQTNGFTPPQVLALIEHLGTVPGTDCESPGGALYDRLSTPDAIDWNANEGWPWSKAGAASSSPYVQSEAVRQAQAATTEAERLERSRQYCRDVGRRELAYGEFLNRMTDDEILLLIGSDRIMSIMLRPAFTAKGRDSPDVRPELLALLERTKESTDGRGDQAALYERQAS